MAKTNDGSGGVWDQDLTPTQAGAGAGSTFARRTQENAVRDDWDDDDDDDDDGAGEGQGGNDVGDQGEAHTVRRANGDNSRNDQVTNSRSSARASADDTSSRIWEEANQRTPMPELIVARASTSQSVLPPPPAALQPTLRILKRPSPNAAPGSSSGSVGSSSAGTSPTPGGSGTVSPTPRGTLAEREVQYQEARNRIFGERDKDRAATVVRDPLGPESELEDKAHGPAKGFGERRRGRK